MCNQYQTGIDLTQAASNLGDTKASTQPEKQAQTTAGREPQPELSGRDDPLLNELRKQCQLHHSELSSLAGLDLPGAPYQDVWLEPGGAELASLFPDVMPLSLEQLGAEADPQEFESSSISLVGRNGDMLYIHYQDGTVECCPLNQQGQKHGLFALYYPSEPYLKSAAFELNPHVLQQKGLFYQGLPCGPFELFNENGVCVGKGCYELMEAGPFDQAQDVNLKFLQKLIDTNQQDDNLRRMLFPDGKVNRASRYTRQQEMMPVCLDRIVVRYGMLAHTLPHGQIQTFEVRPEHPAVLLQRHANETWLQACTRAHHRVLHLVQMQVNELRQAQRAAAQLLAHAQATTTEPALDELKSQLTAPCFDDEVGRKIHQRCLEDLGKLQPEALVTNCERGGYALGLLNCLLRTADGRYLNGILVSSPEYYERQCYRRQVEQSNGDKSKALTQDRMAQILLKLAHFFDLQQSEKAHAPDLEQSVLTTDELGWVIEQFNSTSHNEALVLSRTWCVLKFWGELQHSVAADSPRTPLAPTQAQSDIKRLTTYVQQHYGVCHQLSDLTSYGLRWGHYFYSTKHCSLSNSKDSGYRVLPIWARWDITPINVDAPLSLLNDLFCWHAAGESSLYDVTGTCMGYLTYNQFGMGNDTFQLYDAAKETSVYGQLKHGQLQPTLTFTIYQDYRTKFPAATLTVDLAQGSFSGSYHTIYGIDELLDAGYHVLLLETYDEIETEEGTKKLKRLINYMPGSYIKERGVYLADGAVQLTKQYELEPYQRPRPVRRRPWYYDNDEFDDDEYEDELAELWGDEEDEDF